MYLNELSLPFTSKLGFLEEHEGIAIYPLPGGKVDKEYMDGTREVSLPFEIAIKAKDQEAINTTLWTVSEALSDFDLDLPSRNNSYLFSSLEVGKPFLNDLDEQNYYVFMLDVIAHLEIRGKKR